MIPEIQRLSLKKAAPASASTFRISSVAYATEERASLAKRGSAYRLGTTWWDGSRRRRRRPNGWLKDRRALKATPLPAVHEDFATGAPDHVADRLAEVVVTFLRGLAAANHHEAGPRFACD